MANLCRSCAALSVEPLQHCRDCGSARLVSHPDLANLSIAHLDCDAFFAAIEKRDAPELKSKPVIVGGGKRGVVATCCYIARLHGVRSAMPMFKALKACPDAVVVKPNGAKYSEAARQIRAKMDALTPLVQAVSIDEAYMDLSGTTSLHGASAASLLARLALEIERDVGITVSIGLSSNKFLAKTASEMDKPRGFAVLSPEEAPAFLAPHSPAYLHGVGPKLAAKLKRDGYETVADLQAAGLKTLIRAYGETGQYLHHRANGIDHRRVEAHGERKSVSSETTFDTDIADLSALTDRLWQVCEKTARRAKAVEVEGAVVVLKLKTSDFKTITRRTTLPDPTQLARSLFEITRPMLARETASGKKFRLIGVGLSELADARGDRVDLVDPGVEKRAAAERATDAARAKFGDGAVLTGRALRYQEEREVRRSSQKRG
ncbi:MAG: DNA polymerase IV [Hyphomonadaceae bacterium]|nr:DNA polymerase IV [Hyphomonadaceae bacterium]